MAKTVNIEAPNDMIKTSMSLSRSNLDIISLMGFGKAKVIIEKSGSRWTRDTRVSLDWIIETATSPPKSELINDIIETSIQPGEAVYDIGGKYYTVSDLVKEAKEALAEVIVEKLSQSGNFEEDDLIEICNEEDEEGLIEDKLRELYEEDKLDDYLEQIRPMDVVNVNIHEYLSDSGWSIIEDEVIPQYSEMEDIISAFFNLGGQKDIEKRLEETTIKYINSLTPGELQRFVASRV